MKDTESAMRQRMISGCSVQFDRIYIEVDEEIMSTITDIEGKFVIGDLLFHTVFVMLHINIPLNH